MELVHHMIYILDLSNDCSIPLLNVTPMHPTISVLFATYLNYFCKSPGDYKTVFYGHLRRFYFLVFTLCRPRTKILLNLDNYNIVSNCLPYGFHLMHTNKLGHIFYKPLSGRLRPQMRAIQEIRQFQGSTKLLTPILLIIRSMVCR